MTRQRPTTLAPAVQQIGEGMTVWWSQAEAQIAAWGRHQARQQRHLEWESLTGLQPARVGWWSWYPLAEVRYGLELSSQRLALWVKHLRETREWLEASCEARLRMLREDAARGEEEPETAAQDLDDEEEWEWEEDLGYEDLEEEERGAAGIAWEEQDPTHPLYREDLYHGEPGPLVREAQSEDDHNGYGPLPQTEEYCAIAMGCHPNAGEPIELNMDDPTTDAQWEQQLAELERRITEVCGE